MTLTPDNTRRPTTVIDVEEDSVLAISADRPGAKPYNEDLRKRLVRWRDTNGQPSLSTMAKMLDSNPSQLSRYLQGQPLGDVPKLEDAILSMLSRPASSAPQGAIAHTSLVRQVSNAAACAIATRLPCLIYAPPGMGLTTAIQVYADADPLAIVLRPTSGRGGSRFLERSLYARLSTRGGVPKGMDRWDWIVQELTGAGRLIIVDDAWRLTKAGESWLFDLGEAAGCPLLLCDKADRDLADASARATVAAATTSRFLRRHSDFAHRLALCRPGTLDKPETVAVEIAGQIWDRGDVQPMARSLGVIAQGHGHIRALVAQLAIVRDMVSRSANPPTLSQALAKSHLLMHREYSLAG